MSKKKHFYINTYEDHLENNIGQDVEMITIQEENDDNINGILEITDDDGKDDTIAVAFNGVCNNDVNGIKSGYEVILSNTEDYSNSTLSGENPYLSHRVSKNINTSSDDLVFYMPLNPTYASIGDSNLGRKKYNRNALNLDVNPSEPLGKYQCFLCPLNFAEQDDLSKHLMKHFDTRLPYMCQVCEKSFALMNRLKTHISNFADIRPYECEQCDASFTTSSKLCQHKRKTHSGMRPLECSQCDYKTFDRNHLNRHTSIHLDDRPFKCNYCSYSTKAQIYLTTHEKIHKNDKKYKCDICYSRFIQPQSLRYHRKTHFGKGSAIQRCRFCPSEFSSPDELRKHVENVHRDEILK